MWDQSAPIVLPAPFSQTATVLLLYSPFPGRITTLAKVNGLKPVLCLYPTHFSAALDTDGHNLLLWLSSEALLFPSFLSWLLPFPFSWLLLLKYKYWSASRLNCLLSKLITHVSHKRHRFNPCVGKILLRRKMATISSIHAWKMPWTEAPGKLQSKGSQRVGYNWATKHTCMHVTLNIIRNWWKSPNFSFWLQFLP